MTNDTENELAEQGTEPTVAVDSTETYKQVEEIKEAVHEAISETVLSDKVGDLRIILENLSEEVDNWRGWQKTNYLETIETLKSQVDEIQTEWDNVSTRMKTQSEKLESLLQTFPGAIETATLKALSLRVSHLEQLIAQLFQESNARSTAIGTRKQLVISLVALGVTITLWGVFIVMNVVK